MKDMLYSVAVGKQGEHQRYIVWCDEHWYETTSEPRFNFTKAEAEQIVNQLKSHFQYFTSIIGENGTSERHDLFNVRKPAKTINTNGLKLTLKF